MGSERDTMPYKQGKYMKYCLSILLVTSAAWFAAGAYAAERVNAEHPQPISGSDATQVVEAQRSRVERHPEDLVSPRRLLPSDRPRVLGSRPGSSPRAAGTRALLRSVTRSQRNIRRSTRSVDASVRRMNTNIYRIRTFRRRFRSR